jgi:hypothetical protein
MKWFYLRVRRGTNVVCSATDMAKDHSPRLDEAGPAEFNQSSELPEPPLVIACNPNTFGLSRARINTFTRIYYTRKAAIF